MADTKKLYKGFEEPLDPDTGKEMDDKQRSAWQSAIDSRILDVDFKIPDAPTATSMKAIGSPAMEIPTTVGEPEYAKPKEGATGEDVARAGLDVAGSLPVVGEAADLTTMGLDIKKGDYPAAAISGAAVLLPFVSAGMLKAIRSSGTDAAKKASKQLDDLEKGLESGSISKEQAQIQADKIKEDFLDYKLSEGSPKSAFEPFPEYVPSPTGIMSDSTKKKIEDAVSKVKETSERIRKKTPGGGGGAKALREFHLQDRPDLDLNRSPKFAVPDSGGDLVIRDLGPLTDLDRQELEFVRKKYNLSESELKELRDELGSRGYDYFVDQNRRLPPDRMPRYRAEVEDVRAYPSSSLNKQ